LPLLDTLKQNGFDGVELPLLDPKAANVCSHAYLREKLLDAARSREIDVVLVLRLDLWGRSLADLSQHFRSSVTLGVGFVSVTEALDLTTSTSRVMTRMLAVFAEFEHATLRERFCLYNE
jgi:hypothetical protein